MATDLEDHIKREESRLDRIESKIDKLTDAMIQFGRTEEKIISLEKQIMVGVDRLNRHSDDIDSIRNKQIKNTQIITTITFATSVIFTAVVGVIAKLSIG